MRTVPGGKYRLTDLQVRLERLLDGHTRTVRALSQEASIVALAVEDPSRWRDIDSRVRTALHRMDCLGLVRQVSFSDHRHAWKLTDEGYVDLLARGETA